MANVITIDGTTSSGKSTVGFIFAQRIDYQFIDSGLIYRVAVILAQRNNIDVSDEKNCARTLAESEIEFKTEDGKVKVYINSEDVTFLLKTHQVDNLVSKIATQGQVVLAAHKKIREAAAEKDSVVAGRDIGAGVFTDAKLKFFITASVEARAKRRYNQLIKDHPEISLEEIKQLIKERDELDSNRQTSPMKIPENAIPIDTSDMSIDQVVEELMKYYQNAKI